MFLTVCRNKVGRTSVTRSAARQQSALRPLHTFPEQRCAATSVAWENEHTAGLMFHSLLLFFHTCFCHPTPKSECALNFDLKAPAWDMPTESQALKQHNRLFGWARMALDMTSSPASRKKEKISTPKQTIEREWMICMILHEFTNLPMKVYQICAWMSSTSVVGPASGP